MYSTDESEQARLIRQGLTHIKQQFDTEIVDDVDFVTAIPARILKLAHWTDLAFGELINRATLFHLQPWKESDGDYRDSLGQVLPVSQVIEPVYVVTEGRVEKLPYTVS